MAETRQAAYRRRQNAKLRELRRVREMAAADRLPEAAAGGHWFEVDLRLPDASGPVCFAAEAGELSRLVDDVRRREQPHGTYALVRREGGLPGLFTLPLVGLTVAVIRDAPGYHPPPGYAVASATRALMP